jgi:transcriptional antiterminator RfaH
MSLRWCVVQTKPHQERKALDHLQNQGFEAWLPTIQVEKIKAGRIVGASQPFFSRYLFVRMDPEQQNWAPIRSTQGVSQLLRQGQRLSVVPDIYMDDLQQRMANSSSKAALEAGDAIEITFGPFKSWVATFQKMVQMKTGEERAMAFLSILGKEQSMCFDLKDLKKAH